MCPDVTFTHVDLKMAAIRETWRTGLLLLCGAQNPWRSQDSFECGSILPFCTFYAVR